MDDFSSSTSVLPKNMLEFKDLVKEIEMEDVKHCSGLKFTWNQKPLGDHGLLKKLDRIMANGSFLSTFVNAIFQPYRVSDHSTTCGFKAG